MKKANVVSKIINSMIKVFPEKTPAHEEYFSTTLKNEGLNFQLVYQNQEEYLLKLNTIEVRGALAAYADLRIVEPMPATLLPLKYIDDYYISKETGMYPELLRPFDEMGLMLPIGQWRAVWVHIENANGLPVGTFDMQFVLKGENGEELDVLTYTVEVLDVESAPTDLKLTNWIHYDCIADRHGVEPFSEAFYKVFENYLKAYVKCGFTMLLTPLFTSPLDTKVGGERRTAQLVKVRVQDGDYVFDLAPLEKFIRFVLAHGVQYIEFSHLFTQWGGKCCPKIVAEVNGEEKRIFGWDTDSLSDDYKTFLSALLPQVGALVKKLGLERKCVFHLTDEPTEEHFERYQALYRFVKPLLGDLPTMDALSHYEYYEKGAVDIPVPVLNTYQHFKNKGLKELYLYYCCGPTNMYFTNRLMNMPLQRTRILGMQLYETGVQGFLHWGFNFYNSVFSIKTVDPYLDTSAGGGFPSGDSFIVYPTKEGSVLHSVRFEALREGFQDYRALKMLEGYIGREKVLDILHAEGIFGLTEYPRDSGRHARLKQKINALICNYATGAMGEKL